MKIDHIQGHTSRPDPHLAARTLTPIMLGPDPSMPFQLAICPNAFCTSVRFLNTFSQYWRSS